MSSCINFKNPFTMPSVALKVEYHTQAANASIRIAVQTVTPQVEKTTHFMRGVFATLRNSPRKIMGHVSDIQKKCTAKMAKIYTKLAITIKETWKNTDPKKIKAHLPSALWKGFLLSIGGAALCALASLVVVGSFIALPHNPTAGIGLVALFAQVLGLTSMLGGIGLMLKNS